VRAVMVRNTSQPIPCSGLVFTCGIHRVARLFNIYSPTQNSIVVLVQLFSHSHCSKIGASPQRVLPPITAFALSDSEIPSHFEHANFLQQKWMHVNCHHSRERDAAISRS
jgi:hypothetical protein